MSSAAASMDCTLCRSASELILKQSFLHARLQMTHQTYAKSLPLQDTTEDAYENPCHEEQDSNTMCQDRRIGLYRILDIFIFLYVKLKLCLCVFSYRSRTPTPLCTKLGMLIP
jgi:hypothetical protein